MVSIEYFGPAKYCKYNVIARWCDRLSTDYLFLVNYDLGIFVHYSK